MSVKALDQTAYMLTADIDLLDVFKTEDEKMNGLHVDEIVARLPKEKKVDPQKLGRSLRLLCFLPLSSARAWRDVSCPVSQLFPAAPAHPAPVSQTAPEPLRPVQGITVEQLWRDMRFCIWNDA